MGRYLYHITTEIKAKKIRKNGLYPKNTNNAKLAYDDRVYFFTKKNKLAMAIFMRDAGKLKKGTNCKILVIDTQLLNKDIKIFVDPNMPTDYGCYTYQNIPPSAIIGEEDLFQETKDGFVVK